MDSIAKIKTLPVVMVRGIAPIPSNDARIEVNTKMALRAIEESERTYSSYCILLVQKNQFIDDPSIDDVYKLGVLAKIAMKIKLPNDSFKVRFNYISRVEVTDFPLTNPYFMAEYRDLFSYSSNNEEESVLTRMLLKQIGDLGDTIVVNAEQVLTLVQKGMDSEKLTDVVSFSLRLSESVKYRYVEELDINKRFKYILEDIEKIHLISGLEQKINEEVKKSVDENQKEYFLREKMKAIQNELGDKAKKEEEIEELREKIKNAQMPKHIEEKALVELKRYQSSPSQMAESGIIKTYLDFLTDLPWTNASKDSNDLKKVKESLDQNHYSLEHVKDRIIEYLAVKIKTMKNPQTILCLAGPPGVGKTSLAISIAEALGRKFVKQSLGGVKDESEIRGHRRTYIGALPGRILKGMKDAGTINPVFLLDEIDKMSSDYKGDPASAMLEVLDPEQNARFSDHYLEEEYDLSQVLFITTANYLENIPAPLRDRMEIVELSSYTEHEKFQISVRHLLPKQLASHGITADEFSIDDDAIYYIIRHYTREAGVREVSRYIGTLIRKAIKEILIDGLGKVSITVDNITKYIGKPKFTHNMADQSDRIGTATGLAYTAFGGDTLPVEVTYYKGKGGLVLTGKLGDVMKESAMTALSFVKSHAIMYDIDPQIFIDNDFHVHVPEGAVPKDGPSAGITIATAIYSAVTQKYINKEIGMTGEITLRGEVLAIGGLREKSIAAHRSGLKTILIPAENTRDIDDIPDEVKSELAIIPVSNITDVFAKAIK